MVTWELAGTVELGFHQDLMAARLHLTNYPDGSCAQQAPRATALKQFSSSLFCTMTEGMS